MKGKETHQMFIFIPFKGMFTQVNRKHTNTQERKREGGEKEIETETERLH